MRVIHMKTIGNHMYLSNGTTYNIRTNQKIKPWMHFGRCLAMPYLKQWSYRGLKRRKVMTHVEIWEVFNNRSVANGMVIDHINGDRLDCALWNLREVTPVINNKNRGGMHGKQHND